MATEGQSAVSEFIGTFLLILTVGCNVLGGSGMNAGVSIAAVLMVAIYGLGTVSGAHFNPAVSFAIWLVKRGEAKDPFTLSTMGRYWAVQFIAAAAAGFTFVTLYGESINIGPQNKVDPASSLPGESYGWLNAMNAEFFYTWLLCFVVLRCAVDAPATQEYFGLCIGFVIIAGAYAAGPISGGCFNPAVAFGLDLSSASKGFHGCIWYTMAELLGAAFAAGAHVLIEQHKATSTTGINFFSEFLGTFVLVLTVGLNVITMSPAGALSIAASLMVMIYSLGGVSGAHFNPAVTLACALTSNLKWSDVPVYVIAQLLGGLVAGIEYTSMTGLAFPLSPGKGYNWLDVAVAEVVFTFVLCFVVLNTACSPANGCKGTCSQMYGLAIGFCIVAGGNAIGMVSGGSLNPAVSFGIDASYAMKGGAFLNSVAYTGFEVIGAALAAGAYRVVRPDDFKAK